MVIFVHIMYITATVIEGYTLTALLLLLKNATDPVNLTTFLEFFAGFRQICQFVMAGERTRKILNAQQT